MIVKRERGVQAEVVLELVGGVVRVQGVNISHLPASDLQGDLLRVLEIFGENILHVPPLLTHHFMTVAPLAILFARDFPRIEQRFLLQTLCFVDLQIIAQLLPHFFRCQRVLAGDLFLEILEHFVCHLVTDVSHYSASCSPSSGCCCSCSSSSMRASASFRRSAFSASMRFAISS